MELTPQEKQIIMLNLMYPAMPHDVAQALEQANLFLNGGEIHESDEVPMRLYSFAKDANLIFAAFKATHGIDLQAADLHWWVFLALFMDLGQDTTFCQLIGLRKRIKTGKATKEEREAAREMGEMIDLPELDDRSLEEKEMAMEFEKKVEQARIRQNGS